MISQRDAFWNTIYDLAKQDRDLIVISADMGAPSLDKFRRDFPAQFINTGIAEQNTILVASGLAKEGKRVFAYAIGSFLTLNCIEKIRVQNSMMNIPITLVGVGAGFSYPDSGPTHHLMEDLAIMRALPNITTLAITDSNMAIQAAHESMTFTNTHYIRLERQTHSPVYESPERINLSDGAHKLRDGRGVLVIANGEMLYHVSNIIDRCNLNFGLCDLFRYPINQKVLSEIINPYTVICTVEETFLPGGMGSAVLEVLNDLGIMKRVIRMGPPLDKGYCYRYGGREQIHQYYDLDEEQLTNRLKGLHTELANLNI